MTGRPRALVAGVGNVLRGDDGFGPAVIRALEEGGAPPRVRSIETGIGGMGIIYELLEGFDALVVVDAVDRGEAPGTLYILEPDVPETADLSGEERRAITDIHQLVPGRTLLMARALGILPSRVRIVGCQPGETEELTTELTPPVAEAVPRAVEILRRLVAEGLEES